ncbi:MAG: hypothetical protein ACT4P4_03570 [Betaproteobacteria bacterium]
MRALRLAVLGLGCLFAWQVPAVSPGTRPALLAAEAAGLRTIAGWLRAHGVDGWVGADVADAMGIARAPHEEQIEAKQRGFRTEQTLRVAQLLDSRDALLFMVQRPDDQVFFYLSSVSGGLQKAFVSIPSRNLVAPLGAAEAESSFAAEVLYWQSLTLGT